MYSVCCDFLGNPNMREPKVILHCLTDNLYVLTCRIVKFNDFLSFAGLHLFLQTQLPVEEIDGFLEGKYGENASVEEVMRSQEQAIASEEDRLPHTCSSEKCGLLTSSNWDISTAVNILPSTSEADDSNSMKSLSGSFNSSESLLGPISSSVESSSFMYTVYR